MEKTETQRCSVTCPGGRGRIPEPRVLTMRPLYGMALGPNGIWKWLLPLLPRWMVPKVSALTDRGSRITGNLDSLRLQQASEAVLVGGRVERTSLPSWNCFPLPHFKKKSRYYWLHGYLLFWKSVRGWGWNIENLSPNRHKKGCVSLSSKISEDFMSSYYLLFYGSLGNHNGVWLLQDLKSPFKLCNIFPGSFWLTQALHQYFGGKCCAPISFFV